jgi:hypothetical protein
MTSSFTAANPMSAEVEIDRVLRAARRSLRLFYLREGLCGLALLGAASFALALGVAATMPFPLAARVIFGVLLVALLLAWLARQAIFPWLRIRSPDQVALHLERTYPSLRSRLISAVQLRRELPGLATCPRFSEILVRSLIEDAARAASELDLAAVAPRGRWVHWTAATLGIGALLGILWALAPGPISRALANLAGGEEVSGLGPVVRGPAPLVGDLTLRYSYPEYTGLPSRLVESTSGEISALKGTVVQIGARATIPVSRAEIRVGDEAIALRVSGQSLEGVLSVVESGTYQFVLTDENGKARVGSPPLRIQAESDRPPQVRIVAPGPEVVVGEQGRVEVSFSAADDFGLRDLWLVFQVEGGRATPHEKRRQLKVMEGSPRVSEGTVTLSVFDLGLRPGERVAYRLRVHDNDVVSGPKRGESAVQYLKVYSPRERYLELLEEQRRVWEGMVHLLGEEILLGEEAAGQGARALARAEEQARVAASRSDEVRKRLEAVITHLREDRMSSERARSALEGLLHRLRSRASRTARWLTASVGGAATKLSELASFVPRHVAGLEQDVLLLEKLYKQQKIEALRALTEELLDSHRRLKDLLEAYRRTQDPDLKAELGHEIDRLQEKLRELRAKLAGLFDVDDEFVNLDAFKAGEVQKTLGRLQEAIQKGDFDGALREIERMAKDLQSSLASVELSSKTFYESAFFKSQKKMEKTLDEVHELEGAERELAKEIRDVERQARRRGGQELDVAKSERARRIQKQLEGAHREANDARSLLQSRWNQELAERGAMRAREAAQALEQGDAAEALDMAQRGLQDLKQLRENLARQRPWQMEPSGERSGERARRAAGSLEEAIRALDRWLPRASERLSEAERQRLEDLGRHQIKLRDRAGRLKRQVAEAGEDLPFFGEEARQSLDEAHEQMGRAESELLRLRPQEAASRADQAADALGRVRDKLQQALKPQRGLGGRDRETGEGDRAQSPSRERVRIPGAEEYRAPKEFREDLLKAMKQAVPPPYRDLVRRYYEELVR